MSLGYLEHSRTRYLRNHYEIYDYRKEKDFEKLSLEEARAKREAALEQRQQERRDALEALIEANRAYTPSSRLMQEIEEESRQKRLEKERERERKAKLAEEKEAAEKFKARLASRSSLNSRISGYREERTSRLEKQAQFNKIERDRRSKEREARSYAKSGIKADDSDSDEEIKAPVRRSAVTRSSVRPSTSSHRLVSKYRDSSSPTITRAARTEHVATESAPIAESSHARSASSSSSSSKNE